jgi:isoleucyl-tRNA synthetase
MADWKDTLNLPRTDFPMKANLERAEPEALARWDAMELGRRRKERRRGAKKYVLHDGPPYANGHIHIGHALNKILKDFVARSRDMAGFDAPYVPGWDCHGLPIELQVDRELGPKKRTLSIADFRRACRAYAERFVAIQRDEFVRLLCAGDWAHPYLTMEPRYQAAIVRALGRFVARDLVYKGKKPVHWCIHCRTALAEAEVEYEPHASPSIYVEFPLAERSQDELSRRVPELAGRPASVLIWTTTPWTIPSNLAIAFHPDLVYGAYDVSGTVVVVAEALAERVAQATGRTFGSPVARVPGRSFEGIVFRHPLYDRDSMGVLGDHVTIEQGTGAVHTAPGHGADDFNMGVKYGLEIYAPVGPAGHFAETVEHFGGLRVFDANPAIEDELDRRGRLWKRGTIEHAYPHCWRCHNPVIFLATWQWFIALDKEALFRRSTPATMGAGAAAEGPAEQLTLRAAALAEIRRVKWIPPWGAERIHNMLSSRPDWCISRQRSWGVPIPALDCTSCGEAVLTADLVERAALVFERHSADAWYERPLDEFVPADLRCPKCGSSTFERERDILDVWFDSGSSHEAVLARPEEFPGLTWPARMYLEGSDQHRGWFHSSLLVGVGGHNQAPYKEVLTHGFVVDEDGRKMSKSLGNVIAPQEVIKKSGAEILRLWVSMVDYREEVRLGPEVLARVVEAYRKLRNTCRILVANLYDFDPARDGLPLERLAEIDRYALARYANAARHISRAYDAYDYPAIFQALNTLVTVDLSAFYIDVSKDRLYTLAAGAEPRRSAQTALAHIADGLSRWLAPLLPVTADELWRHLPGARPAESVHLTEFPAYQPFLDENLLARWERLRRVREAVNAALEPKRQDKTFGNSLAAQVRLSVSGDDARLLDEYRDDLPMLFIVSHVDLDIGATTGPPRLEIEVTRAEGERCDRCWRYVPARSGEGICGRCQDALAAALKP